MLRRANTLLAACIVMIGLGGCMTQQDGAAFQQAMLNGLAQGMLAGAGANIGQAIASGNKRLARVAAAQMAAGAITQAGATALNGGRPPAAAGGAPVAGGAPGQRLDNYPDTPQCRELQRYLQVASHPGVGLSGQGEQAFVGILQREHACLASAPDHPQSRSRACGGGRYLHYTTPDRRGHCGWRQAVAAANAQLNAARWYPF